MKKINSVLLFFMVLSLIVAPCNVEGQRYKPNPAERDYFLTWGKLPEHVIADDCQVCDQYQARLVLEKVKAWNQLYFDTIREDAKEAIEALGLSIEE